MTTEISHHDADGRGTFLLLSGERKIGEMTYRWVDGETILIDHTAVDDAFQGQGLARKLVDAGVAFARSRSVRIVPACSYVAAVFRRDKTGFADVFRQ